MPEGDERVLDNSLGRLLALCERAVLWADIAVLLVCIPGAYLLGDNGPWLLLLLVVSGRASRLRRAT